MKNTKNTRGKVTYIHSVVFSVTSLRITNNYNNK